MFSWYAPSRTICPLFTSHGLVHVERLAGEADEHEHDAHVHHVAAVAPGVAMRQFHHRGEACSARLCRGWPIAPLKNSMTTVTATKVHSANEISA